MTGSDFNQEQSYPVQPTIPTVVVPQAYVTLPTVNYMHPVVNDYYSTAVPVQYEYYDGCELALLMQVIIFFFGWFFFVLWVAGAAGLKHRNPSVKLLARINMTLFTITSILVVVCIIGFVGFFIFLMIALSNADWD